MLNSQKVSFIFILVCASTYTAERKSNKIQVEKRSFRFQQWNLETRALIAENIHGESMRMKCDKNSS